MRPDPYVHFDESKIIGLPVFTYDDERLGTVVDVIMAAGPPAQGYLVVTGTMFGTGRYYVPETEIQRASTERVLLKITRDDLRELDWLAPPAGLDEE
jgi:hypothetical protein